MNIGQTILLGMLLLVLVFTINIMGYYRIRKQKQREIYAKVIVDSRLTKCSVKHKLL